MFCLNFLVLSHDRECSRVLIFCGAPTPTPGSEKLGLQLQPQKSGLRLRPKIRLGLQDLFCDILTVYKDDLREILNSSTKRCNKAAWWQDTLEVAWAARTVHRVKLHSTGSMYNQAVVRARSQSPSKGKFRFRLWAKTQTWGLHNSTLNHDYWTHKVVMKMMTSRQHDIKALGCSTLCDGGKTLVEREDNSFSTARLTTSDDDSLCIISSAQNIRLYNST